MEPIETIAIRSRWSQRRPGVRWRRLSRHRGAARDAAWPAIRAFGGLTSNSLVSEISAPIRQDAAACGVEPFWTCGHAGGGNLAQAYANYGKRVSGPQVGAIAVMSRRGGGHVGVVSGVDPNGDPIIVSGNHNRTLAESVYPAGRITAYVMPGG